MKQDIKVFSDPRFSHIVYDPQQREYYNTRSDIFLTEDDISYYKLRPYTQITSPLPKPLPTDYFTNFSLIDALKEEYNKNMSYAQEMGYTEEQFKEEYGSDPSIDKSLQDLSIDKSLQDPSFTESLQRRKPK